MTLTLSYGEDETTVSEMGRERVHRYDFFGALVGEVDAAEQEQGFGYNWDFRRERSTDALGRTTRMAWNACCGQLAAITNTLGYTTQMEYDERNNLIAYADAQGRTTHYEYDGSNNLVAQIDAADHTVHYAYDEYGHVISTTDALGHATLYGYDDFGQRVAITDALGHVTTYDYDTAGRLITTTNPAGEVTVNAYDEGDNLIRVTRNYTTAGEQNYLGKYNLVAGYGYDEAGWRVVTTDTLGHVTRSWYDAAGRLISTTANYSPTLYPDHGPDNAWNLTTWYGYDAGCQVLVTDTLGHVTYTEYDDLNRVLRTWRNYTTTTSTQNYRGIYNLLTGYGYDPVGNQILVTDTLGYVTRSWYDELNRLISTSVNYSATIFPDHGPGDDWNITTWYGYDPVGNQILVTDTLGHVTYAEYDELNRPVTVTANYVDGVFDPARPDEDLVRVTTYDAAGRVAQTTDHASRFTFYEYDALGRQTAVIQNYEDGIFDPAEPDRDLASLTIYDELGQVAARVQVAEERITTTYGYDTLGRLITTTDALSGTTVTHYDALGRRIQVTDPESRITTYEYDGAGRLVTTTNPLSGTFVTRYDALGRRVAAEDPLGNTSVYTYDAAGRLVAQADPLGHVTRYGYDALGRRTVVTDADDVAVYPVYDSLGRLVETRDALGNSTRYGYDALGNRTQISNPKSQITQYEYDAAGRLVAVTENYTPTQSPNHQTNVRTEYEYDASGNLVAVTDALSHTTTYTYDLAGRRVAEADPLGNVTHYVYDGHGRRVGEVYPDDEHGPITVATSYNALGWSTQIEYPAVGDVPGFTVEYTYDALGHRSVVTDSTGATTFNYDALYRPLAVEAPTGKAEYQYDAAGRRTNLVYPTGEVVTYTHDAGGRLRTVTDWEGGVTVYTYTAAGRLSGMGLPNGVRTAYAYDAAGRLVEIEHRDGQGELLARYEYRLDGVGNRVAVTETLTTPSEGHTAALPEPNGFFAQHPADQSSTVSSAFLRGLPGHAAPVQETGVTPANWRGQSTSPAGVPPLIADFVATPLSGTVSLTVTFTNTTTGEVDDYEWDFGDGVTSTLEHPTHVYTATGVYTVSLTATGPGGSDTLTRPNYITVTEPPQPPVAGFVAAPLSGDAPLTVVFTNTTTGEVDDYEWDFGDGVTSTLEEPTHVYTATGVYTVSLTATGPGGSDTLTRPNYITVTTPPPVAGFVAAPLSGDAPLTVVFTNTTTGEVTGYVWDYGDGITSTTSAVTHTHVYEAAEARTWDGNGAIAWAGAFPGTGLGYKLKLAAMAVVPAHFYTVTLTATGPGGSDTLMRENYIAVAIPSPVAGFVAAPLSGDAPLTVVFTNTTTGEVDDYEWDFGDGVTSTLEDPTHVYTTTGVYTVSLTATGPGGSDTLTRTRYITAGSLAVIGINAMPPVMPATQITPDGIISVTFSGAINAGTVNTRTFTVYGQQTGIYTGVYTVTGASVQFDASRAFEPGEVVWVTLNSGIKSTGGIPLTCYVQQFRTVVRAGSGDLRDSGQRLGPAYAYTSDVVLGDLDGDGDLDAFTTEEDLAYHGVGVWLNQGGGVFTSSQYVDDYVALAVALGDVDVDGDLDAFVGTSEGGRVYLNDGTGSFTDSSQQLGGLYVKDVALGDVDGDSDLDALVANPKRNWFPFEEIEGNVETWLNEGTGVFTAGQVLTAVNGYGGGVALGDVDGDGDLDAFFGGFDDGVNDGGQVWTNEGGVFTDTGQELGDFLASDVALGDVGSDGDLDALASHEVWLNDGTGLFTGTAETLWHGFRALGDVDGDGDLDVLTERSVETNNGLQVWENDGTGAFTTLGQVLDPLEGNVTAVALGDVDDDGDLDAFAGYSHQPNRVWLNEGTVYTFTTRVITYTYDSLNRLTGAEYSTGESFEYAYDAVGNRTVMTSTTPLSGTVVTTYTYDAAKRLTGRAVSDGRVYSYTWSARGQLLAEWTQGYPVRTFNYGCVSGIVHSLS